MKALVWGGGAIGGTVAAYLSRAGHDVAVIDANAAHVAAIREHGLRIEGPIDTFVAHVPAFTPDEVEGPLHQVLLAVKAPATEAAVADIAPLLAEDGFVVSLQNGLNEWAIAERVGEARTVGAFVNFGADVLDPGTIHYGGRGAFVLGELDGRPSARVDALAEAIRSSFDPDVRVTDDIFSFLWGKMGYGAMLFASALTDETIADVIDSAEARPILRGLAREVLAVAQAEGVRAEGFNGFDPRLFEPGATGDDTPSFDAMVAFNRASAKARTGVWRDLAVHKRPTEIRAQYGPILAAAERNGIDVPLLRALTARIEAVEQGRLTRSWDALLGIADDAAAEGAR